MVNNIQKIQAPVYLVSDLHLGFPDLANSIQRQKLVLKWANEIKEKAKTVVFLGDTFDYWFEYKQVIPRGFNIFWNTLELLKNSGINLIFFTGNHDMWLKTYLIDQYKATIYREPQFFTIQNKLFLLHHGDGLGPGDYGYKFLKKFLSNKFLIWCFTRLHPNFGLGLMKYFSKKSRLNGDEPDYFLGADQEWLVQYCEDILNTKKVHHFIFGHRHLPICFQLSNTSSYYHNLGDWLQYNTYGTIDHLGNFELLSYEKEHIIYPH